MLSTELRSRGSSVRFGFTSSLPLFAWLLLSLLLLLVLNEEPGSTDSGRMLLLLQAGGVVLLSSVPPLNPSSFALSSCRSGPPPRLSEDVDASVASAPFFVLLTPLMISRLFSNRLLLSCIPFRSENLITLCIKLPPSTLTSISSSSLPWVTSSMLRSLIPLIFKLLSPVTGFFTLMLLLLLPTKLLLLVGVSFVVGFGTASSGGTASLLLGAAGSGCFAGSTGPSLLLTPVLLS